MYFYTKNGGVDLLFGDALRLTQVLTNLLSNALKFTDTGNIVVTIELLETKDDQKGTFVFSVEDSGIGISDEGCQRLFQPFSQADSSTTRKFGGTGLGLVISKNIVNAMGGEIEVQSKVGVGSKFYFTLAFAFASCEIKRHTPNSTPTKALIVDDQEISREILKNMLMHLEYSFDEASNGVEALECIKNADAEKSPYDILLIDWNMPLLNGVDTLQKLQKMVEQKELSTKIPTIFMISGYAKEEIDLHTIDIDSFISKPVTQSALFDAITDAKGGRRKTIQTPNAIDHLLFKGLRALVVEDNEINQEVVGMMLQRVGIDYDVANNGQEGVELFFKNQERYDLILMDLQMPIMSGYEATKEIRKYNQAIPIIALTAAAMIEDKEKVLQAGMNEHVGKPIDKNELYSAISKFCGIKLENAKTEKTTKEILDEKYLLDLFGSHESIYALVSKFKIQLEDEAFGKIIQALESQSPEAKDMIHALKGSSGNIGAYELCDITTLIDAKHKKQEPITAADIDKLQEAKERLMHKIDSMKSTSSAEEEATTLLSDKELDVLLQDVKKLLKEGTLIEDATLQILYKNLSKKVPKETLEDLKKLVEDFEFDKALEILHCVFEDTSKKTQNI